MKWGRVALLLMVAALGLPATRITSRDALASQSQVPLVKIQPPDLTLPEAGGNFTVEVLVENTSELGAFEFEVQFDPEVILFVDVQPGAFLGSTGREVICEPAILKEGSLSFGCHTSGPTPTGPTGSGSLALLTFSSHIAGVSTLTLLHCELSNTAGDLIPAGCQSGTVTNPVSHFCPLDLPELPDQEIAPVYQHSLVGRDFTVKVEVADASELGAFEFTLLYDPAVVSLREAHVDRFLGSTGRDVICEPPILDEGTVRFGCHSGGPTPTGPSGSGPLALLTFSALTIGRSPLALVRCELSTISGVPIPANCKCGSVDIVPPPGPGVGGKVLLPPAAVTTALAVDSGGRDMTIPAVLAAGTFIVAGWYASRRWLRSRL